MRRTEEHFKYLVIGNSVAAIAAVEAIRSLDREGSLALVAEEPYHTYARPLISYFLSGEVTTEQLWYRPPDFYQQKQVSPYLGVRVTGIDAEEKKVFLEPAWEGAVLPRKGAISCEWLLIATGSRPAIPPLPGINLPGVYRFWTLDDVLAIKAAVKVRNGDRVIILGAGLVGLKAAEALSKLGCRVQVVEVAEQILGAVLNREAASLIQSWLEEHGIKFWLGCAARRIAGEEKVRGVELDNGEVLEGDLVVVATGVRANTALVRETGIKVGQGILADERQQTSREGIFCAGDVCESRELLSGQRRLTPILPSAYFQGRVAGINMAGGDAVLDGTEVFNATTFFGLPVITMGFGQKEGEGVYRVTYGPDGEKKIYRSLVFEGERLVGAIMINCGERAGILLRLMREKVKVGERAENFLPGVPRLLDFWPQGA